MNIFLSYASEDHARAEEIALALGNDGHEVFFDRAELAGGEHYHGVIRERVAAADLLVFLVSPQAVEPGGYTLTELRAAQDRWPSPRDRVVPVLLAPTPMERIPAYLRAVTLFEPKGNAAAEIASHVERLAARRGTRRRVGLAVAVLVLAAGAGGYLLQGDRDRTDTTFESSIAASDFVTVFVMPADAIERTEYTLDPTSRLASEDVDVVRLERLAFGRITDGRKAFSVRVSVTNTTGEPIQLDLTPRFFELADDRGQRAELLYFCCEVRGDVIAPGQQRVVELVYATASGWEGKETTPGTILFNVSGLLPVARATWAFRPLATAA